MARRPPPIPQPIDVDEALRLYRELGTYTAVADELGCHPHTVARHLRERGEPKPPMDGCVPVRLYAAWYRMLRACADPAHGGYRHLGARGIGVAKRWESFPAFKQWALATGWKRGLVLARKNPRRNFTPANCHWVTRSEQMLGRELPPRRTVAAFGTRKGVLEWTRDPRCSLTFAALLSRFNRGWYPEDAIRLPPGSQAPRKRRQSGGKYRRAAARRRLIDWDEVVRRVVEDGESYASIADDLGVPRPTIAHRVKRAGGERPTAGRPFTDDGALYQTWTTMRRRMPHARRARRGRRPRIGPEWEHYPTFRAWARRAGYRSGLCLVRVDLQGDWTSGNCRFVPRSQVPDHKHDPKMHLRRRPRWLVEAFGEEKGPTAWSRDRRCAISLSTLIKRIRGGWRAELALTTPPQKSGGERVGRRLITAFGETKSMADWLRDRRCVITSAGLQARLKRGVPVEQAIGAPPWELHVPGRGRARARDGKRGKTGRRC